MDAAMWIAPEMARFTDEPDDDEPIWRSKPFDIHDLPF